MTKTTLALTSAIARVNSQMSDQRDFDDEEALFRVGDVREIINEIERLCVKVSRLEGDNNNA